MTNEDALARIHEIASLACFASDGKVFDKAIEALEKQIEDETDMVICAPNFHFRHGRRVCGAISDGQTTRLSYCPICGKKLKYKDGEA